MTARPNAFDSKLKTLVLRVWLILVIATQATCLAQGSQPAIHHEFVRSFDGAYIPVAWRKPNVAGPFPAVLIIHGGVGGLGSDGIVPYLNGRIMRHFHERGYVTMATDYRRYHFGEDEIQDVIAAYRKLQSLDCVDEKRVAVIGGSHGGYLAEMVASRITPAVTIAAPGLSDIEGMFLEVGRELREHMRGWDHWREYLLTHREKPLPGFKPSVTKIPGGNAPLRPGSAGYEVALELGWRYGDLPDAIKAISPHENTRSVKGPVLFLVGGDDPLRHAGKSWVEKIKSNGGDATYSEYPNMTRHFFWGWGATAIKFHGEPPKPFHDALTEVTSFIELHLKTDE